MLIIQNYGIVYIKVPWYYQSILWSNLRYQLSDLHLYSTKHYDNTAVPYNTV